MEIVFKKQNIDIFKPVYCGCTTGEAVAEVIVPDAQPDVGTVLDTDGTVMLKTKEAAHGTLTVTGIVSAAALYIPEDGGVPKKVEAQLPFRLTAECGETDGTARIVSDVRLVSVSAKTLNPRKLQFTAIIAAQSQVFVRQQFSCPAAPEEDGGEVDCLENEIDIKTVASVTEKTFVLSGDVPVPGAERAEVLRVSAVLGEPEGKQVGTKLILRGSAVISCVYNESGEMRTSSATLEYSQVLEPDKFGDDCTWKLCVVPTGLFAGQVTGGGLPVELDAVVQCVAEKCEHCSYITDTYSPRYQLRENRYELAYTVPGVCGTAQGIVRDRMATRSRPQKVLSAAVRVSPPGQSIVGAERCFTSLAEVTALYETAECGIESAARVFEVAVKTEDIPQADFSVTASSTGELFVTPGDDELDVRLPVNFTWTAELPKTAEAVSSVSYEEGSPLDLSGLPSVVCLRVGDGDTAWSLAKRFSSTVKLIAEANSIDGKDLEQGKFIIIPRKS